MQRSKRLQSLHLDFVSPIDGFLSIDYPQLRKLTFHISRLDCEQELISHFFRAHQQIRYLDITCFNDSFDWSVVFVLENLETWHMRDPNGQTDKIVSIIDRLPQLTALRKLLWEGPIHKMPKWSNTKHLDRVEIILRNYKSIDKDLLTAFAAMPNLTGLHLNPLIFSKHLKWSDFVDFIESSPPCLKRLTVSDIMCEQSQYGKMRVLVSWICSRKNITFTEWCSGGFYTFYYYGSLLNDIDFIQAISNRDYDQIACPPVNSNPITSNAGSEMSRDLLNVARMNWGLPPINYPLSSRF